DGCHDQRRLPQHPLVIRIVGVAGVHAVCEQKRLCKQVTDGGQRDTNAPRVPEDAEPERSHDNLFLAKSFQGDAIIIERELSRCFAEGRPMPVVLIGTLDTKGTEIGFVRDLLRSAGVETLVIDAGVMGPPAIAPDVSREEVFAAAGTSADQVRRSGDRGRAVTLAATGAARVVERLHAEGKVQGVLGLGGSAGTTIGTAAMRGVPDGVAKIMVRTLASGQGQPHAGVRGICMVNSVTGICALNMISR